MCGRFAFYSAHEAVARLFGVADAPPIEPHWNIAPTQFVPAVRERAAGDRRLALLYWGLVPYWAEDKTIGTRMINARSETLREKAAFREAYRKRRCLVLADGYYEWLRTGAVKQPYFIHLASGEPFGMAGLWESWRDRASGERLESCAIVTTDASASIRKIHERMPVVLAEADWDRWLDTAYSPRFERRGWSEHAYGASGSGRSESTQITATGSALPSRAETSA